MPSTWLIAESFIHELQAALRGDRRKRAWEIPASFRRMDRRTAANSNKLAARPQNGKGAGIAVLGLLGVLEYGRGYFGDTDLDAFGNDLAAAVAEPQVGTILIFANSPGGSSTGILETGRSIRAASKVKRVVSYSIMSCSASFWLTSAAPEAYMLASGDVGSVGVFSLVMDISQGLADAGMKPEIIRAPDLKFSTSGLEPLPDATRAAMQADVATTYNQFLGELATFRGMSKAEVASKFGKGLGLMGPVAKAAGAVDGLLTPEEIYSRVMPSGPARQSKQTSGPTAEILRLRKEKVKRESQRAVMDRDAAIIRRRRELKAALGG